MVTDIPDAEVHRGLYELVTRGLLPKTLDATAAFEGDVLALTGMACHQDETENAFHHITWIKDLRTVILLAELLLFAKAWCPNNIPSDVVLLGTA